MSIALMTAVFRLPKGQPGTLADRMVLLALADSANDEGVCWPKQATLAAKCGVSVVHAKRALARLRTGGWLSVEQTHRDDGGKSVCRYLLNTPRISGDTTHRSPEIHPLVSPEIYQEPSVLEPSVEPNPPIPPLWHVTEIRNSCESLAHSLRERGYRCTITEGWLRDMERLHRIDGRTYDDIGRVIRWLDRGGDPVSDFWRVNVRSPAKLRQHWDVMRERYAAHRRQSPSARGNDLLNILGDL